MSTNLFQKISKSEEKEFFKKYGKKIRVGKSDYEIVPTGEILSDGVSCWGLCDKNEKKIYVRADAEDNIVQETLIHELSHAALDECHVSLTTNWNRDVEEIVIESITSTILHTFEIKKKHISRRKQLRRKSNT
jgi:hypothetical protein